MNVKLMSKTLKQCMIYNVAIDKEIQCFNVGQRPEYFY